MRLRYYDDFLVEKVLSFRNASEKDSVLTEKIYSDHILEVKYSVMDAAANKEYFNVLYLKKGDSINIALEEFQLKNQTDNKFLFVSDFLEVNSSIFRHADITKGLRDQMNSNRITLRSNLTKIDSLLAQKKITDSVADLWKEVSNNFYYLKQSRLNYTSNPKDLDTLVSELKSALAKKTNINSTFLSQAIVVVANYNKTHANLNDNLNTFVNEVININTEKRYKAGVAFQALKAFPEKKSTLYLETYNLFKNKLNDSAFMAKSYANEIIPIQKSFDQTAIKLITPDKASLTLADIFRNNKGKVIVFDLWASWCVPCIAEFPYLEKTKARLATKNISFIGIGLDKDIKEKDWKDILAKSKVSTKNQFRVMERSNKLISQLYRIETIPRYLVFDTNGMLVNDHFLKPSDKDFEQRLLMYVQPKKD